MHKKLYNLLGEHNILFNNQFGFRKNNSTSLALIKITEKIKESIDNKDLWKAFDSVNHSILLTKWNTMELGVLYLNGLNRI